MAEQSPQGSSVVASVMDARAVWSLEGSWWWWSHERPIAGKQADRDRDRDAREDD